MKLTLSHIDNETRERKCYLFLVTISTWARPGPLDYQSRYNRTSSSWKGIMLKLVRSWRYVIYLSLESLFLFNVIASPTVMPLLLSPTYHSFI